MGEEGKGIGEVPLGLCIAWRLDGWNVVHYTYNRMNPNTFLPRLLPIFSILLGGKSKKRQSQHCSPCRRDILLLVYALHATWSRVQMQAHAKLHGPENNRGVFLVGDDEEEYRAVRLQKVFTWIIFILSQVI
jgi:hypothetical protein